MQNKKNSLILSGIIFLAYTIVYNQLALIIISDSSKIKFLVHSIDGIKITNIYFFLSLIIFITSTLVIIISYFIYKVFLNISHIKNIDSLKLLTALLLSMLPGSALAYTLLTFHILATDSILIKILSIVCSCITLCLLISEDAKKKERIKFTILSSCYCIVNIIISVMFF
mgnify:FL=1